jgi:predicted dehydrogenase
VRVLYEPDPARRHQRQQVGKSVAELAAEFGVRWIAESYEELLQNPLVAVVAVFSPYALHAEQVGAALRAGKHVIVTKPLAVSLDEARQLVDLVDRTGRQILVAQSMRWNSMSWASCGTSNAACCAVRSR